jgi:HEAT repeat protein
MLTVLAGFPYLEVPRLAAFSAMRAFTNFRTGLAGGGLSAGKRIVPLLVSWLSRLGQTRDAYHSKLVTYAIGESPAGNEGRGIILETSRLLEEPMRFGPLLVVAYLAVIFSADAQSADDLVKMLKSKQPASRRFAADLLGKQKAASAIPALADLLKDEVPAVREAASAALAKMGQNALLALTDALRSRSEEGKFAALSALRQMGPEARPAISAIAAALKDKNVDVRIHAASVLGSLKDLAKPVLPELFAAAKDTSNLPGVVRSELPTSVAEAAITACLEIDNKCLPDLTKAALPALTNALKNKDESVLQAAGNALALLGPEAKAALPALESAYKRATGLTEGAIARAIVAVGSDGTGVLASIVKDIKAPLQKRLRALSDLGEMANPGDKAVSILIAALKDQEPQMRAGGAMALAMIGPDAKAAVGPLVDLLADETLDQAASKVRSGATKVVPDALTRIGSDAVPALAAALKDGRKSSFARWQAAGTLANLGRKSKPALAVLETAMKDKDKLVAVESACAFVLAGGDAGNAMPVLEEGLKDKSSIVAWNAADAVRRLGPKAKETVPLLTALLKRDDKDVRIAAAQALSTMGPDAKSAVPALAKLLEQKDPQQQLQVILVLRELGPNAIEALPALIERLKDVPPASRRPLLFTIGALGPKAKDAVPVLTELLKKKEVSFHLDAMLALGKIGPSAEAAVPLLQAFLSNPSEYPRANAARALGGIGPKAKAAVPILEKLVKEDKKLVRIWAAFGLARIAGESKPMVTTLIEMWKAESDDSVFLPESVRFEIAEALELLGADAQPARDLLLETLLNEQEPPGMRSLAARAVGNLRNDADVIVPKLIEMLDRKADGYARVLNCVDAAQALGMLGPAANAAVPRLRQLAEDDDNEIARAAAWALGKIAAD